VIGSWTPFPYIAPVMNTVRCLLAALLLLVFGGGTALASVQSGDLVPSAIETTMNQTMPGGCDHCGDNEKAMVAAMCSIFGACIHGMISPANAFAVGSETLSYSYGNEFIRGFQGAPDPFPPKSDILA